jgi:fumarate hydratase subunit beta
MKNITTPLSEQVARSLQAGERVLITGTIYTGRDAAHKRMVEALDRGEKLPIDLEGQIIFYVGPCPAKPGQAIGSAGPTTSGRMDSYAPRLMAAGLRGMIGKGLRQPAVVEAMKRYGCVYLVGTGGAGALLAQKITQAEVVAFPDLGTEAVHRLQVKDFPVFVGIDMSGTDMYAEGVAKYRRK